MVSSPLKRIGGKSALAERLIAAFPPPETYDNYVDTCGGAAWVLLEKPRYDHNEVFNDLDNNIITFWQEMRDHSEELRARLTGLLHSRKQYYDWYRSLFDQTPLDPMERAVRFFYCLRSTGTGWLRKSPVGWDYRPQWSLTYEHALELFGEVQQRFQRVVIDNRDVLATIRRYDSPRTFFYIDPPYLGAEQYYEASRKDGFPHQEMAALLAQIQGQAAVSYYPHPDLDAWYAGWRRQSWYLHKSSQIKLATRKEDTATEILLCNYAEPCATLWE